MAYLVANSARLGKQLPFDYSMNTQVRLAFLELKRNKKVRIRKKLIYSIDLMDKIALGIENLTNLSDFLQEHIQALQESSHEQQPFTDLSSNTTFKYVLTMLIICLVVPEARKIFANFMRKSETMNGSFIILGLWLKYENKHPKFENIFLQESSYTS